MATTATIEKLKRDRKKIEDLLRELENQMREVEERYAAMLGEENKIHEELRQCREASEYSRLEMRLHPVARRRREVEAEKQAIERRIRGYRGELEKVKARIEYMRPKGEFVPHKEE